MEILLIKICKCNFHPSRARNYTTTIISKLNNFAEVLAVHVDVYMATAALRSITGDSLCDTGHVTLFTTYQPTTTKSDHFKPSILVFFAASPQKNHRWKKLIRVLQGIIFIKFLYSALSNKINHNHSLQRFNK